MTSINAIRFNDYSGAMVCDEQRGWNPENMIINSADKIKPVIPDYITKEQGIVACYGNTGTSTIGDELKFNIRKRIQTEYDSLKEKINKIPDKFTTISELAKWAFEAQTKLKRDHIDQTISGRHGFTTNDLIRGFYNKDSQKVEIKDSTTINSIHDAMTWKGRTGEMTSVFLNAGIIAGYDPEEGFRIFSLSMIEYGYYPVQEIFLADGSGRDLATLYLTEYSNRKTVPERRSAIHRTEGIFEMINAVNAACRHDIGVEGYLNIILFDGHEPVERRMRTINDDRSKLATEIVRAWENRFLDRSKALEFVEALIWSDTSWNVIDENFWKSVSNPDALLDIFRGYPEPKTSE
ncbi:hypothetical protein JW979_15005 [bacterium]|nr:hypothetical protein [candidate division CSSED10-310 bacterium]